MSKTLAVPANIYIYYRNTLQLTAGYFFLTRPILNFLFE